MAVLKSIFQKSREYVFKAFGNGAAERPAKIIFRRFPLADESFPAGNAKSVLDGKTLKGFDGSKKAREELVEAVINGIVENMAAQRVDYRRFVSECVERVESLEYEGKSVETPEDFLSLPQEAVYEIAAELYSYAKQSDEFNLEEKKS